MTDPRANHFLVDHFYHTTEEHSDSSDFQDTIACLIRSNRNHKGKRGSGITHQDSRTYRDCNSKTNNIQYICKLDCLPKDSFYQSNKKIKNRQVCRHKKSLTRLILSRLFRRSKRKYQTESQTREKIDKYLIDIYPNRQSSLDYSVYAYQSNASSFNPYKRDVTTNSSSSTSTNLSIESLRRYITDDTNIKRYLYKQQMKQELRREYMKHMENKVCRDVDTDQHYESKFPDFTLDSGQSDRNVFATSQFWDYWFKKRNKEGSSKIKEEKQKNPGCAPDSCHSLVSPKMQKLEKKKQKMLESMQKEEEKIKRQEEKDKLKGKSTKKCNDPCCCNEAKKTKGSLTHLEASRMRSGTSRHSISSAASCTKQCSNHKQTNQCSCRRQTPHMPCQKSHDEITNKLKSKYNGEIICIHNPPCVLINGCLNLPANQHKPETSVWPLHEDTKMHLYQNIMRHDQASQYYPCAVQHCQMSERNQKSTQSVCNHKPPCEVVPRCYKLQNGTKLYETCIHVPVCEQTPECVMDTSNNVCVHKPRCVGVPLCVRDKLNSGESRPTQTKDKTFCNETPCLIIPKWCTNAD